MTPTKDEERALCELERKVRDVEWQEKQMARVITYHARGRWYKVQFLMGMLVAAALFIGLPVLVIIGILWLAGVF